MANPVGRPSELQETLVKAKEYLFGGYEAVGEVIPSVAGLSCYTGKARHRLREYGALDDEFRATLDAISSLQESRALNKGLTGEFNSTITKLLLANHGYSDKQEIEHTGANGGAIQTISAITTDPIEAAKVYQRIMGGKTE
jgi:hypothetical protein